MNSIFVQAQGGLGNQLFQYALALNLSKNFPKTKIYINKDKYSFKKIHEGFLLENLIKLSRQKQHKINSGSFMDLLAELFINFLKQKKLQPLQLLSEKEPYTYQDLSFIKPIIYLKGYWQSFKYFNNHSFIIDEIQDFLFSNLKNENYYPIDFNENNVAVHLRLGDYVGHSDYQIITKKYYDRSIDLIKKNVTNPKFFIFTNDEPLAKKLNFFNDDLEFIPSNYSSLETLALMSKCKHFITSNSSFSWWGAYLGLYEKKMIITPDDWFTFKNNLSDLIPDSWIMLKNN